MTKYGVQLPNDPPVTTPATFERIARLAVSVEASGFDSVWATDEHFTMPLQEGAGQPAFESYTLLGALAARTERVQLGAMASGPDYWNPGVLAKMATTLDVLSGGRAVVGIGATRHPEGPGRDRIQPGTADWFVVLEEAVQVCRALFESDDVTFSGTHFRLAHARNLPRPIQRGGPNILIAGDEPGALRLAARYADKCNITGDASRLAHQVEVLHRLCEEMGRDPAAVEVTWSTPLVLTASHRQTRHVLELTGTGTGTEHGPSLGGCVVGQPGQIPDLIADHLAAGADEISFILFADAEPAAIVDLAGSLGLPGGSPAGVSGPLPPRP